jgi:small subunit ribosomal protein S1
LDEYIAEHKEGDVVTGRMIEVSDGHAHVELGEGIQGKCRMEAASPAAEKAQPDLLASEPNSTPNSKLDLSALGSMLQARWKGSAPAGSAKPEAARTGEIRKFRITKLDTAAKRIELEWT